MAPGRTVRVALAAGLVLLDRDREAAANALRSAALLALLACIFGIADAGPGSFGLWHLALTIAVAGTLVAPPASTCSAHVDRRAGRR